MGLSFVWQWVCLSHHILYSARSSHVFPIQSLQMTRRFCLAVITGSQIMLHDNKRRLLSITKDKNDIHQARNWNRTERAYSVISQLCRRGARTWTLSSRNKKQAASAGLSIGLYFWDYKAEEKSPFRPLNGTVSSSQKVSASNMYSREGFQTS